MEPTQFPHPSFHSERSQNRGLTVQRKNLSFSPIFPYQGAYHPCSSWSSGGLRWVPKLEPTWHHTADSVVTVSNPSVPQLMWHQLLPPPSHPPAATHLLFSPGLRAWSLSRGQLAQSQGSPPFLNFPILRNETWRLTSLKAVKPTQFPHPSFHSEGSQGSNSAKEGLPSYGHLTHT